MQDQISAAELWSHYQKTLTSLSMTYESVRDMPADSCPDEFVGLTHLELSDAFDAMRTEVDHKVNLMLAASIEAQLQTDAATRAKRRLKDYDWRRFRGLRKRGSRVELEHILDLWRELLDEDGRIGRFKQFFKHRHWLAHGRYWTCKCGNHSITLVEVWDLIADMSSVLPPLAPVSMD